MARAPKRYVWAVERFAARVMATSMSRVTSSGIYERPVAGWAFRTSNACKGTKNSLGEPSPRYSATTKAVRPDYQNTAVGTDLRRTGTSPITTTGATTTSFMLGNG